MSKLIIPSPGILHLPDAYDEVGTNRVVGYCRVSDPKQRTNGSLSRQRNDVLHNMIDTGGKNISPIQRGVELGFLSRSRPLLRRTINRAKANNAILLAWDVSRLVRPAGYSRTENPFAAPTEEDFERLFELAKNVPIATVIHPDTDLREIHSNKTKMGMEKATNIGRPPSIRSHAMGESILADYATGQYSYSELAEKYGVHPSSIKRFNPKKKLSGSKTLAGTKTSRPKRKRGA